MIDFLSSWGEQIIVTIVVGSILEMILPDSKNKKYIKMIIGIYILFSIISPVIDKKELFNVDNFNIESYAISDNNSNITEKVNQQSMDERLQELYIQELENNIKAKITQEGFRAISCKVDAVLYGNKENQEIKKINLVVSKNDSDKDKTSQINSNIKSINKVEINTGLSKILSGNDETEEDSLTQTQTYEIQKLKDNLSSYYEINSKKIIIKVEK